MLYNKDDRTNYDLSAGVSNLTTPADFFDMIESCSFDLYVSDCPNMFK